MQKISSALIKVKERVACESTSVEVATAKFSVENSHVTFVADANQTLLHRAIFRVIKTRKERKESKMFCRCFGGRAAVAARRG